MLLLRLRVSIMTLCAVIFLSIGDKSGLTTEKAPDKKVSWCPAMFLWSRLAAGCSPASCVCSNLISPLLLKPKLLSILVIAGMKRTRWLSNLWRMPSLIMIKLRLTFQQWAENGRTLQEAGAFFVRRQMQTAATGRRGKRSVPYLPVQMGIAADFQNSTAEWTVSLKKTAICAHLCHPEQLWDSIMWF